MKCKPYLLFIAFFGLIVSCNKDTTTTPLTAPISALKGVWELRNSFGGYTVAGNQNRNFSSGNGNLWKFTDSTYEYYVNGQLSTSGNYHTLRKDSSATANTKDTLVFTHNSNSLFPFNSSNTYPFELIKDSLKLYIGSLSADGYIDTYVPIKSAY